MVKLGIIRKVADLRMLLKARDPTMPFPQKQKPPQKEDAMFTLHLTSTHSDQDVWLSYLGASFHMTPPMEWFVNMKSPMEVMFS